MGKHLVQTKMLLGIIKEDTDLEYNRIKMKIPSIESAITMYESAIKSIKTAAKENSNAFLKVSKASSFFLDDTITSTEMKTCDKSLAELALSTKNHYLSIFVEALEKSVLEDLKSEISNLKMLDSRRNDAAKEYKMADVLINEKERKYKEKNKLLSDSTKYSDMVEERLRKKEEFEKADELFKEKASELLRDREQFISSELLNYLTASQIFFSNITMDFNSALDKLKK